MAIWSNTDKRIEFHNQRYEAGEETYVRGHNLFSDMTTDEKRTFLGLNNEIVEKRSFKNMIKQKASTTRRPTTTTTRRQTTTTTRTPTTTTTRRTTATTTTTRRTTTTTTSQSINGSTSIDWRTVPGT